MIQVTDMDSSSYSWSSPGVRHPLFPSNYVSAINNKAKELAPTRRKIENYIACSSHTEVRAMLRSMGINYIVVYPNGDLKNEYLERYRNRGSDQKFIDLMDANWGKFIFDCQADPAPIKVELGSGENLDTFLTHVTDHDWRTFGFISLKNGMLAHGL